MALTGLVVLQSLQQTRVVFGNKNRDLRFVLLFLYFFLPMFTAPSRGHDHCASHRLRCWVKLT
jgi:hypothetical protein